MYSCYQVFKLYLAYIDDCDNEAEHGEETSEEIEVPPFVVVHFVFLLDVLLGLLKLLAL